VNRSGAEIDSPIGLPAGCHKHQFLGEEWLQWLDAQGVGYVLRIRANTLINGVAASSYKRKPEGQVEVWGQAESFTLEARFLRGTGFMWWIFIAVVGVLSSSLAIWRREGLIWKILIWRISKRSSVWWPWYRSASFLAMAGGCIFELSKNTNSRKTNGLCEEKKPLPLRSGKPDGDDERPWKMARTHRWVFWVVTWRNTPSSNLIFCRVVWPNL